MQMTSNKQTVNEQKSTSTAKAAWFSWDPGFSARQWANSKLWVLVSLIRMSPSPLHTASSPELNCGLLGVSHCTWIIRWNRCSSFSPAWPICFRKLLEIQDPSECCALKGSWKVHTQKGPLQSLAQIFHISTLISTESRVKLRQLNAQRRKWPTSLCNQKSPGLRATHNFETYCLKSEITRQWIHVQMSVQ